MGYERLISNFWEKNKQCHFSPLVTRFYYYLMHQMHIANRNPFLLSERTIRGELRMTKETLKGLNQVLESYGLLKYEADQEISLLKYTLTL